mgnify:CR=1 FL=1
MNVCCHYLLELKKINNSLKVKKEMSTNNLQESKIELDKDLPQKKLKRVFNRLTQLRDWFKRFKMKEPLSISITKQYLVMMSLKIHYSNILVRMCLVYTRHSLKPRI